MAQFCSGDGRGFALLFDRHALPIKRFLVRLTGNPPLATDLTQSTFLSVMMARDRFVPGSRFKQWLYTIAMNAVRDHHRRTLREAVSETPAAEPAFEPALRDAGLERAVHRALSQLGEEQREAVVLHHFEGLSFREIATAVSASESAVKVRAHRGYARLRELLRDTWESSHGP